MQYKLLTLSQPKIDKSNRYSDVFRTAILHLAPSNLSGVNLCPYATKGCIEACLNTSGRGKFDSIQQARIIKSLHFIQNREGFLLQLHFEILAFINKCKASNKLPAIRLNGTSDIRWEHELNLSQYDAQFYDYTKWPINQRGVIDNYHLTYSANENLSNNELVQCLNNKVNIAMVFKNELPQTYLNYKVIDGTKHDLRFLDPKGVVVGLLALGRAKNDNTGFVRGAA